MCHQGLRSRWASGLKAPWVLTIQWPRRVRRVQKPLSLPGGVFTAPRHAAVSTIPAGSSYSFLKMHCLALVAKQLNTTLASTLEGRSQLSLLFHLTQSPGSKVWLIFPETAECWCQTASSAILETCLSKTVQDTSPFPAETDPEWVKSLWTVEINSPSDFTRSRSSSSLEMLLLTHLKFLPRRSQV